MIYQDLYWNAAWVYLLAAVGFWLVVWKVGTKLPWRPLRWWLTWLYLCIVLTPWQGTDPEPYYAPAIIVGAFDFLDLGLQATLDVLKPMFQALIVGTTVIVFTAIVLKIRALKAAEQEPKDETETTLPKMD
jgi:hypothetical protein